MSVAARKKVNRRPQNTSVTMDREGVANERTLTERYGCGRKAMIEHIVERTLENPGTLSAFGRFLRTWAKRESATRGSMCVLSVRLSPQLAGHLELLEAESGNSNLSELLRGLFAFWSARKR